MNCNSFAVASDGGYYFYPLPGGSPFKVRLTLKGVAAPQEISRLGGSERAFVLLRQVHGTKVVPAAEALHYPEREEADGLLITPGSPLCGLQFGDCVPVLILSASREPWMLALHSGFRGTLKNIVASGMDAVRKEGMAADGEKLHAWVGPCISGSCYSRSMSDPTAGGRGAEKFLCRRGSQRRRRPVPRFKAPDRPSARRGGDSGAEHLAGIPMYLLSERSFLFPSEKPRRRGSKNAFDYLQFLYTKTG